MKANGGILKKLISYLVLTTLIIITISGSLFVTPPQKVEAYNNGALCDDTAFINSSRLDDSGIQNFLVSNGSFLKDFTEGGRTAAQIIGNAARENGINPIAILATIQKEEGIISGTYATTYNQTRNGWAMGYGYTDSQIYAQYWGFTTQVDYGTWQFRRNYDLWATNGSIWNVGNTVTIDGVNVVLSNRCTSSLYRYTPHLGGNQNFAHYFDLWGGGGTFNAQLLAQGPYYGLGLPGVALVPGQVFTVWANLKNTGTATWDNNGATPVHLGAASPYDRASPFFGNRNLRGYSTQSTVAPGEIGTFVMTFTAPAQEGTYSEHFRPVAEYVGWLGQEVSWTYTVSRSLAAQQTKAAYLTQGPYSGPGSYNQPITPGNSVTLWVKAVNTGSQIWFNDGANPTHLGLTSPRDHNSPFLGGGNARGTLVESQVPPGAVGTFQITVTAPATAGSYVEHFQPVTEYISWFGPDVSWPLLVQ